MKGFLPGLNSLAFGLSVDFLTNFSVSVSRSVLGVSLVDAGETAAAVAAVAAVVAIGGPTDADEAGVDVGAEVGVTFPEKGFFESDLSIL